ncbi:MAG: glycosyl hydrolase, partial [Bacteroidota bacterium]
MKRILLASLVVLLAFVGSAVAQDDSSPLSEENFKGLALRSIGPAFVSGRIADIAIHPDDDNVWYVAVGSGGVWKTLNAGVTWTPIFDNQSVYSTGCITIDPNNPHTIWLGTGENVGGRHVGYGDGIYKSEDDGKTWKNMGLKASEHISKIIVHPENSDVLWVAVQGPLWDSGDERGLYKSTDGGENWKKVLGNSEWTGVTDVVIDPRDPNWLYAATWDRHRTIAAYMGGGPGSGLHRSSDGGETWEKLTSGLPTSNLGKIGIDVSPFNPDVVYAAIEEDRTTGGVYMSTNRGKTWVKQSNAVSGATGPHYYQELYASPHQEGRLYLMDVQVQVSDDHGKTFTRLKSEEKHSDNHAIAFRADDPDYLLMGTDAGIWESFDLAENWRYINNMPITQYYKVAVDDAEPFYWVYGGTQDNGSHGGPSRTDTEHGIRHADWIKTLGADGHQSATEPGNPKITYAETQQGGLHRIDRVNGEQVFIQPQAGEGEDYERFNWDAPIVVSPHDPATLYFASARVWKSTNRGDSWTAISEDLTRDQERISLPIMGRVQSWDNPWDVGAMSNYNTITSLSESPVAAGVIYAGTDDGIIQVSENDGESWTKIAVGSIKGVPGTAFVNDIRADLHDANTVYACLDNHKYGDFNPYLIKSTDRGRTWTSIRGNLPDRTLIWRTVQDHVKPELMFVATEWGIYFTIDAGSQWVKLTGGVPTISFRDITIQRRENDLVGASFGRSFYVLDDYSPLRDITMESLDEEIQLFATKDALWYKERSIDGQMGASYYTADNPAFGAT